MKRRLLYFLPLIIFTTATARAEFPTIEDHASVCMIVIPLTPVSNGEDEEYRAETLTIDFTTTPSTVSIQGNPSSARRNGILAVDKGIVESDSGLIEDWETTDGKITFETGFFDNIEIHAIIYGERKFFVWRPGGPKDIYFLSEGSGGPFKGGTRDFCKVMNLRMARTE